MSFSIAFQNKPLIYPYDDPRTPAATGVLTLGDEKQYFVASLYEWSRQDYEKQWRHAIDAVFQTGKAALITEYLRPQIASHLEWWPMYVVGERVFFQNHLLFYDQLATLFSLENAFSFVRDREIENSDGKRVSEWSVSLAEVEAFART